MSLRKAVHRWNPGAAVGWRRALIAAASGFLLTFGLAPYDLAIVGFLAFPVLVLMLDGMVRRGEGGRAAFRTGWCFGFGYFVGGLWWLGAAILVDAATFWWALPLAVFGLPAVLAVYYGAAFLLARRAWSQGAERILILALAFTLAEWLRAWLFTGFTWNALGMLAAPTPLLMQSAALWGLHGLTFLGVVLFCVPALFLTATDRRVPVLALAGLLAAVHLGYGAVRLATVPQAAPPGAVRISIVQPAIDQSQKWDPSEARRILDLLSDMTAQGAVAGERRLVLWPESSFPYLISDESPVVAAVAQRLGPDDMLLAGAARIEERGTGEPAYFNAILAIGPDGRIEDRFDKLHLVPFGEYLPFQAWLERLGITQLTQMPGGFSAADARRAGQPGGPGEDWPVFLPLICYEAIFPDEIVRTPDMDLIVNVTNDAWYGNTPGPHQHLRHAALSAVAVGLPLVRAANTGISTVNDAAGRPVAALPLGARGIVEAHLPPATAPTPFARFGNWPLAIILGALGAALMFIRR
ncbi:apolipoprotein N-acyltransferase [Aureimonas frigidaquae]|uniref:apolipoprotein N-acyltransferase n=1 Tax=Aureimonas frigidaquae TaxID=424757 RepID=UPI000783A702|nr:apolipoprotein N-acyltransferase [Aureimonas frigidaquae]